MRRVAAGALLWALAATALAAPAQGAPRAAVVFLPYDPDPAALLSRLARRPGMAIGLTSPTVGGFEPVQMALDMSQGARIPTRLYPDDVPPLRLAKGARMVGWAAVRSRAADAPGDVVPGLLAQTIERAGRRAGYAGVGRRGGLGAIVAADQAGRLALVTLGSGTSLARRAVLAWKDAAFLVVDAPRGAPGLRALDRLLAARGRRDLVYVVRAPEGTRLRLLASGVTAPDVHGQLWSATTRRGGLIAATDVAPTVLRALGLRVPDAMQGRPVEGRGEANPEAIAAMERRLAEINPRRALSVAAFLLAWLGLLLASRPLALRLGLPAALWFPGVALVTAELAPSAPVEIAMLVGASFALAALTDRLVPWPAAPAVPAALVFAAHAVDLATGSRLIGQAVTGPNPAGGARFYGVGNELETILAVAVLVGTGAALAWIGLHSGRRAAIAFGASAAVAGAVLGAGRLGADVGAVITLGAGGAAGVLAAFGARPSRRALALAVAAPLAALAALVLIDVVSGGGAHLTRSVLEANGSDDLRDVVRRRFEGSVSGLGKPGRAALFALALAAVVWMALRREHLLRRLESFNGFRAGLIGAYLAVVVGAISNDSGPLILEIGAILLTLALGYALSGPEIRRESRNPAVRRLG